MLPRRSMFARRLLHSLTAAVNQLGVPGLYGGARGAARTWRRRRHWGAQTRGGSLTMSHSTCLYRRCCCTPRQSPLAQLGMPSGLQFKV